MRISNIYATPWHLADTTAGGELQHYLRLWRFEQYCRLSADQLPSVLCREALDVSALKFHRWQHAVTVTGARIWLPRLPSGQIVATLSLDATTELLDTIDLLEDCYVGDVHGCAAAADLPDRPAVPPGIQRDPLPGRAEPPPGLAGRRRPLRRVESFHNACMSR